MANNSRDYEILLKVRADIAQAISGIGKLNDNVRQTQTIAAGVGGALKGAAVSLAGFIGLGATLEGIKGMFADIFASASGFKKLSQQTGLSTDAIQALTEAARENDVAQGEMAVGLGRLTESIGKARAGSAQALQPFRELQINFAEFQKLSPDQQFQLIAQRLAQIKDPADEARIGIALFGRQFLDIKAAIEAAANQGLNAFIEKTKELGIYLSPDLIARMKAVSDQFSNMGTQAHGLATEFLAGLAPALQEGLASIEKATSGASNGFETMGQVVGTVFKSLLLVIEDFGSAVGIVAANATEQFQIRWETSVKNVTTYFEGLKKNIGLIMGGHFIDAAQNSKSVFAQIAAQTADAQRRLAAMPGLVQAIQKAWGDNAANLFPGSDPALPGPSKPKSDSAIGLALPTAAAALGPDKAKAMADALAHLQDQLATLRTEGLDPTAAAWAKYNKTVDDAIAGAAKAGNTPEAQAALAGIVEQAARLRDIDLKKIADDDRAAYEQLRQSLDTPAEANLDQALSQLAQLNGFLQRGVINAQQYGDAVKRIGQGVVQSGRPVRDFGAPPIENELESNLAQQASEAKLHQQNLESLRAFYAQKKGLQAQADAAMEAEEKRHAATLSQITANRVEMELAAASEGFGQLANVAAQAYGTQSRAYKVLFALSKAFAVAQAAVSMGINIAKASEYGFPENIPFIAGAIAQGVEIVSIIAGASFSGGGAGGASGGGGGGYAEGGYTGDAPVTQAVGEVHGQEGVLSAPEVRSIGGEAGFNALRRSIQNGTLALPGYADGGYVHPLANAPTPAQLGFMVRTSPRANLDDAGNRQNSTSQPLHLHATFEVDGEPIARAVFKTRTAQKEVPNIAGDNGTQIRAKWSGG